MMAVLSFTSCEKQKESSELIVGNWLCDRVIYSENGITPTNNTIVFLRMSLYSNGYFTWTAEGDNDNESGTWSLYGNNTLTLNFINQESITFSIQSLSAKELIVRNNYNNGYYEYYFSRVN